MTKAMGAGETRMSATGRHVLRRINALIRLVGLLLAVMLIVVAISGCSGDSSTPGANDQLCTNLSDLQDSVHNLLTVKSNENLTTFKNEWNQVKTDFNSVKTEANQVASANMDPVTTSFNALVTAVQSALTAPSVSAAVSSIQTAAKNFTDTLSTASSDLNCSS